MLLIEKCSGFLIVRCCDTTKRKGGCFRSGKAPSFIFYLLLIITFSTSSGALSRHYRRERAIRSLVCIAMLPQLLRGWRDILSHVPRPNWQGPDFHTFRRSLDGCLQDRIWSGLNRSHSPEIEFSR